MTTVLESLYDGEICPFEQICPKTKEYKLLINKIADEIDIWRAKFASEEEERFDELCSLLYQQSTLDCKENFLYGFKLGAKMLIEILSE